jgi:hypothetical protein
VGSVRSGEGLSLARIGASAVRALGATTLFGACLSEDLRYLPVHGVGQNAPRPITTVLTVRARMIKSSQNDQLRT